MDPRLLACGFIIFSLAENNNLTLGLYTVLTQGSEFGISRAGSTGGAALNPLPATVWVFSQAYTLGFLSAHCHACHPCLLLIFCASFKMLVTEFFQQMPCAMSSNILTWVISPCWLSQTGKGVCTSVQGTWEVAARGKALQLYVYFPQGELNCSWMCDLWLEWKQKKSDPCIRKDVCTSWWTRILSGHLLNIS